MFVAGVHVEVGGGEFDDFGCAVEGVEDEDAVLVGQFQARGDFRRAGLLGLADCGFFLVDFDGFFHAGGVIFGIGGGVVGLLPFAGSDPVDEVAGELFPLVALLREVANAVANNLVFADKLKGSVFEDESVVSLQTGGIFL